jgi:hypothetical protein
MQLKSLYTVRFVYPEGWQVELKGDLGVEEQHFYFAEGHVEGGIAGVFRGSNYPRRRADGVFQMDFQGFIETAEGALVMVEYRGYGRTHPPGRRQVVGAAFHLSDHEAYKRLNDIVCVIEGEVRRPQSLQEPIKQKDVQLVFNVSELIWEPLAEQGMHLSNNRG